MLDHLWDFQDFDREVKLLLLLPESEFLTGTVEQLISVRFSPSLFNYALEVGRPIFPPWVQTHCVSELPIDQLVGLHENWFSGQQNQNHVEVLYSALTSQLRTARLERSEQLNNPGEGNWDVPEQYFLQALHSDSQTDWSAYSLKDPTVNSAVYTCAAYLANFYFVVKCDFAQTRDICSAILNVDKENTWFAWVSEFSYPVLLSTKWSEIFDEHFQAVLGLCVLHERFVCENKGLGRESIIKICPMLFLHYINFRCLLRLGNKHTVQIAVENLKHHLKNLCPSDHHI